MNQTQPAFASPDDALRRVFALDSFRPGQREALDTICAGRDLIAIMPTGGGKSLIYQLAALLLPGTTLVVSPLIALMRDQVESLRAQQYPGVAALNSQIPEPEQQAALEALREQRLNLLYVTPERCTDESFLQIAREARISLLAIDEAHCISQWGHDFRPTYLLLDEAARVLGRPPIAALTATATPWVRDEIAQRLGLRTPHVVARGFDRPNLFYEVYSTGGEFEKRQTLRRIIAEGEADYPQPLGARLQAASAGSGIVYTAFTKSARALSQWLNRHGLLAAYYHGQLKAGQRNAVQERFTQGAVRAIAATNAFGLGIDLPELHYVVHWDAPPSLEAYYQESGRAGRDGALARCPLLFSDDDIGRVAFASGSSGVEAGRLEEIVECVRRSPSGFTRRGLAAAVALPLAQTVRLLEILTAAGAISERRGRYRAATIDIDRIRAAVEHDEQRRAHERTRGEMVRAYAQTNGCRRQFLLQYFGEYDTPDFCGMCDRCVPRTTAPARVVATPVPDSALESPFRPGDAVEHATWGQGIVQHVAEDSLTALFDAAGYRTLDLRTVLERNLLRPATADSPQAAGSRGPAPSAASLIPASRWGRA